MTMTENGTASAKAIPDWAELAVKAYQDREDQWNADQYKRAMDDRAHICSVLVNMLAKIGIPATAELTASTVFTEIDGYDWPTVCIPDAEFSGSRAIIGLREWRETSSLFAIDYSKDGGEAWYGPLNSLADFGACVVGRMTVCRKPQALAVSAAPDPAKTLVEASRDPQVIALKRIADELAKLNDSLESGRATVTAYTQEA